jgi:translation initiation factor IF-3
MHLEEETSIYPPRRFGRFDRPSAGPTTRINDLIRSPEVRLIDEEGKQVGVVPIAEAQEMARTKDLDLVEIAPEAQPPVCKIMDFGKYQFQQKKKQSEAKKKQKVIVVKEVQFRPRIDEHDFEFKKNNVLRFLEHGDKVKAIVRFRGREMTHQELGKAVLDRLLEEVKEKGAAEGNPNMLGNRMIMVIAPNK